MSPIVPNSSDSYAGAELQALAPVVKGDCCLHFPLQELAAQLGFLGIPYAIKGGTIFMDIDVAGLDAICLLGTPTIDSLVPPITMPASTVRINGDNFGNVTGIVTLTNASTWAASGIFVVQPTTFWNQIDIDFTATEDGLSGGGWIYVENDCGERNAAGTRLDFIPPAPEP